MVDRLQSWDSKLLGIIVYLNSEIIIPENKSREKYEILIRLRKARNHWHDMRLLNFWRGGDEW